MDVKYHLVTFFVILITRDHQSLAAVSQNDVNYIANNLGVVFEVISNLNGVGNYFFDARITLTNKGTESIQKEDWEIYFCCLYMIEHSESGYVIPGSSLTVAHVNGCLFKLTASDNFQDVAGGESVVANLTITAWSVAKTDFMPRWYVTGPGLSPVNIKSTDTEDNSKFTGKFDTYIKWKRYEEDYYDPWNATDRYKRWTEGVTDQKMASKIILPTPYESTVNDKSLLDLPLLNWNIIYNDDKVFNEVTYLQEQYDWLKNTVKGNISETKSIFLNLETTSSNQNIKGSYILSTMPNSEMIIIKSSTPTGIFYGVQSLISLFDGYLPSKKLPEIYVDDHPRYGYRGFYWDISRNFQTVDEILKILKVMAMYKLNKFHIHLSDDEAWRLYIPWCPQLANVGGQSCHDLNESSCIIPQFGRGSSVVKGYLTQENYKKILTTANSYHIEVIPEFDMPGHMHAGIKATEQYVKDTGDEEFLLSDKNDNSRYLSVQMYKDNAVEPCQDSTYRFISKLVQTMVDLHEPIQPLKTFHLGGDEVAENAWKNSTKCRSLFGDGATHEKVKEYFMTKSSEQIKAVGTTLRLAVWEDGVMNGTKAFDLDEFATDEVAGYAWQDIWEWGTGKRAYVLANAGYKVVMCQATHLYFDHPYEPDPEERGLYWATRYTDTRKVFGFKPDSLYDNVQTKRTGEPFTKDDLCKDPSNCVPLNKPQNILGMQGHLWSETVRTEEHFEYMVFPRLLALAERAWHKGLWESNGNTQSERDDFSEFVNTLGYKELDRIGKLDIKYRISVPGVKIIDKNVTAVSEFPGSPIQYQYYDEKLWSDYEGPFMPKFSGIIKFRALSADKSRYGRETYINYNSSRKQTQFTLLLNFLCFLNLII